MLGCTLYQIVLIVDIWTNWKYFGMTIIVDFFIQRATKYNLPHWHKMLYVTKCHIVWCKYNKLECLMHIVIWNVLSHHIEYARTTSSESAIDLTDHLTLRVWFCEDNLATRQDTREGWSQCRYANPPMDFNSQFRCPCRPSLELYLMVWG